MGLIYAPLTLANPTKSEISAIEVHALADTGAVHLYIPPHVAMQLGLSTHEEREVVVADGRREKVPYVGPIHIRFANRSGYTGALVMGEEPLLGAIPMEDMDLVLHPMHRKITVNPENPNLAVSQAK